MPDQRPTIPRPVTARSWVLETTILVGRLGALAVWDAREALAQAAAKARTEPSPIKLRLAA